MVSLESTKIGTFLRMKFNDQARIDVSEDSMSSPYQFNVFGSSGVQCNILTDIITRSQIQDYQFTQWMHFMMQVDLSSSKAVFWFNGYNLKTLQGWTNCDLTLIFDR